MMRNGLIIISFLIAFILMLLPMPEWAKDIRPLWVLLILIYWNIKDPFYVGVGVAWIVGMIQDLLSGTLLGEQASAMVLISFLVIKLHSQIRMFSLFQQGLCVFFLTLLYQFIIYCIQGFINQLPQSNLYWAASFLSMLLWPWITSILRNLSYRTRIM